MAKADFVNAENRVHQPRVEHALNPFIKNCAPLLIQGNLVVFAHEGSMGRNFLSRYMRIHPRHSNLLFSLFMSLSMAFIMSGALTAINSGLENFISGWLSSFTIAWPIAFPAVFFIAPRVRRLVQRLTAQIH